MKRAQVTEMAETLTFGVEIETYGLGIRRAAEVVAAALGGTVREDGGYYSRTIAVAPDGREWISMHDGSIVGGAGAEVVTPILRGEADLLVLQSVVRALRAAGAKSDADHGCGVHVHVGVGQFEAAVIGRLAASVAKLDGFLRRATGSSPSRARWCAPLAEEQVASLRKARTMQALGRAWYGTRSDAAVGYAAGEHYHSSRYRILNLHSTFYRGRGTAEFRLFDGTLHAGKIRAYVQLCTMLVAKAAAGTTVLRTVRAETRDDARHLLQGIGMAGDKFATARHHLLAAWPGSRPARATEAA